MVLDHCKPPCFQSRVLMEVICYCALSILKWGYICGIQKSWATWQPQLLLQWDSTITSHNKHGRKQQGRCKKTDLAQAMLLVCAELLHRLGHGSKQHKIRSGKTGAIECKMRNIFLWSLAVEISCVTHSHLVLKLQGCVYCRYNCCKWKYTLKYKEDHQI